jgi:hypothetical protein
VWEITELLNVKASSTYSYLSDLKDYHLLGLYLEGIWALVVAYEMKIVGF